MLDDGHNIGSSSSHASEFCCVIKSSVYCAANLIKPYCYKCHFWLLNVQVAKRQIKRKHMNRKWEYIHASHMQKRKTFSVHYKVLLLRPNVVAVLVSSHHHLFTKSNDLVGLGDLNTTGSTKRLLDVTVDGELTSSEGTDHEETGTDTAVRATETELLGDLDQTAGGALTGLTLGLVDLGQHGVSGLGDDGGGETGDETGAEVVDGLHAVGGLALVDEGVDSLVDLLEDDELGAGVGDPFHVSA